MGWHKYIIENCGLLSHHQLGDQILADRSYTVQGSTFLRWMQNNDLLLQKCESVSTANEEQAKKIEIAACSPQN